MGRKKKASKEKQTVKCNPNCIFFPIEPSKIMSDEIIDGVRQRKVVRKCLYDNTVIKDWEKDCPRGGAFLPICLKLAAQKPNSPTPSTEILAEEE